jgi:hypothetical protein
LHLTLILGVYILISLDFVLLNFILLENKFGVLGFFGLKKMSKKNGGTEEGKMQNK